MVLQPQKYKCVDMKGQKNRERESKVKKDLKRKNGEKSIKKLKIKAKRESKKETNIERGRHFINDHFLTSLFRYSSALYYKIY